MTAIPRHFRLFTLWSYFPLNLPWSTLAILANEQSRVPGCSPGVSLLYPLSCCRSKKLTKGDRPTCSSNRCFSRSILMIYPISPSNRFYWTHLLIHLNHEQSPNHHQHPLPNSISIRFCAWSPSLLPSPFILSFFHPFPLTFTFTFSPLRTTER